MKERFFIVQRQYYKLLFLACGLMLFASLAQAGEKEATAQREPFYKDTKRGWFWYEEPAPVPEPEQVQKSQEDQPEKSREPEKEAAPPSLAPYSPEDLWNMHPDKFQHLLTGLQKKAVQYPTEQNVMEYLTMQDIASRKALAYSNAAQYVTQKNAGIFNVNQVYPTSGPGVTARVQMQQDEIAETIIKAKDDHAILFFVKEGCGFCEKQVQILAYFVDKYGWQIKTIDIGQQPNYAARFNITSTPTLLLIKQNEDQYMPISVGVVSLAEMEQKLYQAVRSLRGDTTIDSFTTYDFQKGSALDPTSILNNQPARPQNQDPRQSIHK